MTAYVVRQSPIHGRGVFATRDIEPGEVIIEYTGRRITHEQAEAEWVESGHTLLFTLNDQYVIDANVGGNESRWINHSCDPNCESDSVVSPDGDPAKERMFIQAVRPIRAGEELTYDYGITTDEPITEADRVLWACHCGAPNCRGVMLEPETDDA